MRTPNWVVMKQSKAHTAGQEDKVLVTHDGSRQSQSDGAWDMCTSRDQEASQQSPGGSGRQVRSSVGRYGVVESTSDDFCAARRCRRRLLQSLQL